MSIILQNQQYGNIELKSLHENVNILYDTCEYVCLTFIDLQNVLDRRELVQVYDWQKYYTNIYFTNIIDGIAHLQTIISKIEIMQQLNFHQLVSNQEFCKQTLIFDKSGALVYDEYLFQYDQVKITKALNKFQHIPDLEELAIEQEKERIRKEQEEQLKRIQEMNFTVLQSQSQIKMVDVSEEDKYLSSPLHFLSSCIILNHPNPYKVQPIIIFYLNTQVTNINYYLDFVVRMQTKYKSIYFLVILLEDYDVVQNVIETNYRMKLLNVIIEFPRRQVLKAFLDYHHIYSFPAMVIFDQYENIMSVFHATKTNNIIDIITSGQVTEEIIEVKQFLKICETISLYKTSVLTQFTVQSEKLQNKTIYQLLSKLRYFNYVTPLKHQGIYIELLSGRYVPEQLYDKQINGVNINKAYQQYARKQFYNQLKRLVTVQRQYPSICVFVVTQLGPVELERLSRFMSELKAVNVLIDTDGVLDKRLRNAAKRRRRYDPFDYCFVFMNGGDIAYQGPALENFIHQYLAQVNRAAEVEAFRRKKGSQLRLSGLKH